MNLRMTKDDSVVILIATLFLVGVTALGWWVLGPAALVLLPVLSTIPLLVVILRVYRRLSAQLQGEYRDHEFQRQQDYRQIESFVSLLFALKPTFPFPSTRGWAISPDLLKKIAEVILTEKPGLVIEASSGVSTLVIAYCLKQLGRGRVVSLEHDPKFVAMNHAIVVSHGLEDIATIVHAPLKEIETHGDKWLWYDLDGLKIDQPIDLLVVDGPPGNIQKLSRYPALPLLYGLLNRRATIVLDDGNRADEKRIVALWEKEFSHLSTEFLDMEAGAYVIHKTEQARAT